METEYTEESLQLAIAEAVYAIGGLGYEQLLQRLFGAEKLQDVTATLKDYVRYHFVNQLKGFVRHHAKAHIFSRLRAGSSEFIQRFDSLRKLKQMGQLFADEATLQTRMDTLLAEKAEGGLFTELARFYDRLLNRFAPPGAERHFRISLVEYFQSGAMTLDVRKKLTEWRHKGTLLKEFKALFGSIKCKQMEKVVAAANGVKTDNFLHPAEVLNILEKFLAEPTWAVFERKAVLTGRLVFLSEWRAKFLEAIQGDKAVAAVEVYAANCCNVDCDLQLPETNVVISSKMVYVRSEHRIDLSGKGFSPGKTKARSAKDSGEYGADGQDGRAGGSSGNFHLVAKEMISPSGLTVLLNGGGGEDGQDGGDGYNGRNGVGVTSDELDKICVQYGSIYRTDWNYFVKYEPQGWDKAYGKYEYGMFSGEFLFRRYNDAHGRQLTYSMAGDKGYFYTTYDLYFMIEGSKATNGTRGGTNGVGGEGGFRGNCRAENPETGEAFPIRCERTQGRKGDNGVPGQSGRFGINGNDMVMIDRGAKGSNKHYYGSEKTKLTVEFEYKADVTNRLDGYQKHVEKRKACFARFGTNAIDTTERKAEAPTRKAEATRKEAKAVAKQSVIAEEVLANSAKVFEEDESFMTDACQEATTRQQEDEEVEDESVENVTEEVNVLRQREDKSAGVMNYVPDSEKKPKAVWTAAGFVKTVKTEGRRVTPGRCAQIMFDLFTVEISAQLLDLVKFHTLFLKNRFCRAVTGNKLTLAVVAALQDRMVDGKSYAEIVAFAKDLTTRHQRKYDLARFRAQLQHEKSDQLIGFIEKFEQIECEPDLSLNFNSDRLYGATTEQLPIELENEGVQRLISAFFDDFDYAVMGAVEQEAGLLQLLNKFRSSVNEKNRQLLKPFDAEIDWTSKDAFDAHMNEYTAWTVEELKRGESDGKPDESAQEPSSKPSNKPEDPDEFSKKKDMVDGKKKGKSNKVEKSAKSSPVREKTPKEAEFVQFFSTFTSDHEEWSGILKPLFDVIKGAKALKERFSDPPTLPAHKGLLGKGLAKFGLGSQSKQKECFAPAVYVIRLWFLAERQLRFTRHLYNCNELFVKETSGELGTTDDGVYVDDGADTIFDHFIDRQKRRPLNLNGEACEKYMRTRGVRCAPTRYVLAHTTNKTLLTYIEAGYQAMKMVQCFNKHGSSGRTVLLLRNDDVFGIVADPAYRDLVAAQSAMVELHSADLDKELAAHMARNYGTEEAKTEFAEFYAKPFRDTIIQWIESYVSVTTDQLLLHALQERFYVDGCHLTPFELQFTLISVMQLLAMKRCDVKFLLLAINSVPQTEIVNVMLYLRILYWRSARFRDQLKIYKGIQLIDSAGHKALFATKLEEFELVVDGEQIYQLILMLQHASSGSEQLKNVGLKDWITIANKQRWSEIGAKIKQFGHVGYYLGYLDDRGWTEEEKRMRTLFDRVNFIPEGFIALAVQLIATREIDGTEKYFRLLEEFLCAGNDFCQIKGDEKRPILISTESEQHDFFKHVDRNFRPSKENEDDYKLLFPDPDADRTTDTLLGLVSGLHDNDEEKRQARRLEIDKIGKILKAMENYEKETVCGRSQVPLPDSANVRLLLQFDDYLLEVKKKRLRNTQKFAVLCAVESDKHVLEQVNTGEGKSFIIAAMAVLRRKLGYKSVDIITSSPVLAKRDAAEMSDMYAKFGLSVAHNCCEDLEERKKAYECDIVYGDMARFQRDFLLHTYYKKNILGDRTRASVIVDEVDNMLLDNGNNMLYLSHNVAGVSLLDSLLIFIHKQINMPIFSGAKAQLEQLQWQFDSKQIKRAVMVDIFGQLTVDELKKLASRQMTDKSVNLAFEKLIRLGVVDSEGYLKITSVAELAALSEVTNGDQVFLTRLEACLRVILNRRREIDLPKCLRAFVKLHLDELIESCKNAMFMGPDNEYVVDVDRSDVSRCLQPLVTIIDSNTGADLTTSQWSGGLHQFLQLKHGCRLSPISLKAIFISNVNYLLGYDKMNGLSGTLGSVHESKTLEELYGADLIKIPTFRPKFFYEHVPVIATSERDWLQSLYDELCDQVNAQRSVLIICESIAQLRTVHNGLRARYEVAGEKTDAMRDCFDNIVLYERAFQDFQYKEGAQLLQCSRLIIATNLAGRGTDIKLSKQLASKDVRGLHVITAFMPANCRIEEQAFGRAARSGDPGSAQIIAMQSSDDGGRQPSVFQLKLFRDNREVHRLASLKAFYDYHTDTEERCLQKFREHCSDALSAIYSSKSASGRDESLPSPTQVVYFALLDKWALWLDEKAPLIQKCAENRNDVEKKEIIESVAGFLNAHPIGGFADFESATKWVDLPQSLLSLGIVQMCHEDGFEVAEKTFDRVLSEGHEFAAEAYYYKACMRMKDWTATRTKLNSLPIQPKKPFSSDIDYAIEHFHKSRTLFANRIQRRQKEAKIVAQFLDSTAPNYIKTHGFSEQFKVMTTVYELIIANIDWLLGVPCNPDMFARDGIDQTYGSEVYQSFVRQGVISPVLVANYQPEKWQLDRLRRCFKLSKDDVTRLLEGLKTDHRSQTYEDFAVLDQRVMGAHVNLSHRAGFFAQLQNLGVFSCLAEKSDKSKKEKTANEETESVDKEPKTMQMVQQVVPVDKEPKTMQMVQRVLLVNSDFADQLPAEFNKFQPVPKPDEEALRNQVRLSNSTEHGLMYRYDDVYGVDDEHFKELVDSLVAKGALVEDWIGQINRDVLRHIGYLDDFEGVTTDELAGFFEIDGVAAAWILDVLCEASVLKRQTLLRRRFTPDDDLWKSKVGIYLEDENKNKKQDEKLENAIHVQAHVHVLELKHVEVLEMSSKLPVLKNVVDVNKSKKQDEKLENAIQKHAQVLDTMRKLPVLKNVTSDVLKHCCRINVEDDVTAFVEYLLKEKLLEDYQYTKFRLFGKLDCSSLPASIANEVDEFLSDRLAYSFAMEHLCQALDESIKKPTTPKKIFLPDNPPKELCEELFNVGLALPTRIFTDDHKQLDADDYRDFDSLRAVINEHRMKLHDHTYFNMELIPFATYLEKQRQTVDADAKAILENGLRMVIGNREASVGWSLASWVTGAVSWCAKGVWKGLKAIGNFFYDIGAGICDWAAPYVDKAVDAFDYAAEKTIAGARYIKQQVVAAVDWVADTEIVKMATQTVKDVAEAVGEVVVTTATAIGSAAVTVADQTGITAAARAVGTVAETVANTVANTTAQVASAVAEKAAAAATAVGKAAVATGQWLSETKAFQLAKTAFIAAMNTAKNAYQKLSAMVDAAVESYQYYNQCRFTARRLATEHRGMLDEHALLRSYDSAMVEQNRSELADKQFEKNMRDYMKFLVSGWLKEISRVCEKVIMEKFPYSALPESLVDVDELLENETAMRQLKTESTDYWLMLSGIAKVTFFQMIRRFDSQPRFNLATLDLHQLPLGQIRCDFGRLAENVAIICEQLAETVEHVEKDYKDALIQTVIAPAKVKGKVDDPDLDDSETEEEDEEDAGLRKPVRDLTTALKEAIDARLKVFADSIFLEPTIQLITAYLSDSRDRPQLATMAEFGKEDAAVKRALTDLNAITQSKKSADFLQHELHTIIYQLLEANHRDKAVLRLAVKFGFPLPLSAAKPIAQAVHDVLVTSMNYTTGITVRVFAEEADEKTAKPICEWTSSTEGKNKMNLRYIRGRMLFLCQADYVAFAKMNESLNDVVCGGGFFFETFPFRNKKEVFPKQHESFRQLLLAQIH